MSTAAKADDDDTPKVIGDCPRHPGHATHLKCTQCGQPICRQCIEQFGYFCSKGCRDSSRGQVTAQDRAGTSEAKQELAKAMRWGRLFMAACGLLLFLAVFYVVWVLFLTPAGKVCWRWSAPAGCSAVSILSADAKRVVVQAGDRLVTLDTRSGRELSGADLKKATPAASPGGAGTEGDDEEADDWFAGLPGHTRQVGDGLLQISRAAVTVNDAAGAVRFSKDYAPGHILNSDANEAGTLLGLIVSEPPDAAAARAAAKVSRALSKKADEEILSDADKARYQAAMETLSKQVLRLVAIDLQAGREAWTKRLAEGVHPSSVTATANALVAVMVQVQKGEDARSKYVLCSLKGDTGKLSWKIDLPEPPEQTPFVAGDRVLFQVADEIHAVSEAGEEAYTLPVPGASFGGVRLAGGLLILNGEGGCKAFDAGTGAPAWSVAVAAMGRDDVVVTASRVYIHGQEVKAKGEEKAVKIPGAEGDIAKEFGEMIAKSGKPSPPMLVAMDRKSGQELWRRTSVYGWVLADERNLMVVADTAETSMLQALTGGKGETIIRRLNPKSGKDIYQRTSDIGFSSPALAGDRVVGVLYEREERRGLMQGGIGESADSEGPPKGLGMAAIRVRFP